MNNKTELFGARDRKGVFHQMVTMTLNSVNSPLFVPFAHKVFVSLQGLFSCSLCFYFYLVQ